MITKDYNHKDYNLSIQNNILAQLCFTTTSLRSLTGI